MFDTLGIIKILFSIVEYISGYVKDKQLLDAGAAQEVAQQLARINSNLGIAQAVADETAKMTQDQVAADLKAHGELRD